ncbi:MAG: clan AA aspartic protease [Planctomycetes bacterium]|nr:clan AA aspartic protease [Planctomycetota bacterium]
MSIVLMGSLSSCGPVGLVKDTVLLTGRAVGYTAVTAGKVVAATGRTAGRATVAGVRLIRGSHVVELEREGNAYYVRVLINGRHRARLLLDTGASVIQFSNSFARRAGFDPRRGKKTSCTLANGGVVSAYMSKLREVRAGRASARDVDAVILEQDVFSNSDGLLGMSFLNHFLFRIDPDAGQLILKDQD